MENYQLWQKSRNDANSGGWGHVLCVIMTQCDDNWYVSHPRIYCGDLIQLIYQGEFDGCLLVAFSSCWTLLSDILIFLRSMSAVSCSVLVFWKRTFSFIFWIIKLEKSEQTVVSYVSTDLNKNAFLLIIWTLGKRFQTSLTCLWISILGSKALKFFILAFSRGILSTLFFMKKLIFSSQISQFFF